MNAKGHQAAMPMSAGDVPIRSEMAANGLSLWFQIALFGTPARTGQSIGEAHKPYRPTGKCWSHLSEITVRAGR
jgi:hypothetical protein